MKSKKIFILSFLFIFIFSVISHSSTIKDDDSIYNDRKVQIDLSSISNKFNNNKYVLGLKKINVLLYASNKDDNSILLKYDDISLTYTYNPETMTYKTTFPTDDGNLEKFNLLNAVFIDCISTMQGNPQGSQIIFAFDDSFDYFTLHDDGIYKSHYEENNHYIVSFEINPFYKMSIPLANECISKNIISEKFH